MTLITLWFMILAFMFVMYVILDGFDLGAAAVMPLVARTEKERDAVFDSIGPVWDGNEVWLLAGGGALVLAFPLAYATSFSGFQLPLMIVLWLLMFRGLSIELRHQFHDKVWRPFWTGAFFLSSLLLAVVFGAALGNVVRGVPMDAEHIFFAPLFTDFRVGEQTGILDWYTVLIGVLALLALAQHGALWLNYKTEGAMAERARNLTKWLWVGVLVVSILATLLTFRVQPQIRENLAARPWGAVFPLLALAGLGAIRYLLPRPERARGAFFGSCAFLTGMMGNAAFGIFPHILPARIPANGLTLEEAAAGPYAMRVALFWFIPGMLLALVYFTFAYSRMPRKFESE